MQRFIGFASILLVFTLGACGATPPPDDAGVARSSSATELDPVLFSGSQSLAGGEVYEVMPGPAVIDPSRSPTPFSNNTLLRAGGYSFTVSDTDATDSMDSTDAVTSADIRFTADGTNYLIDSIMVIHKPAGAGDHTFFGGVGRNETMHGDTGVGAGLMPKMLAYITLWGVVDLKNADTGAVVASDRVIHIMTATRVRDENRQLLTDVVEDGSDHALAMAETHVILPPTAMDGSMSPIPGTHHGFIHMMFADVELTGGSRDPTLVYEILPGDAVIDPTLSPTPFSNRTAVGSGSYSLSVRDFDAEDSTTSRDIAEEFSLSFRQDDGAEYSISGLEIMHKAAGEGDHTFLGGVGYDVEMHGDTGIGTGLMPRLTAYITLWGMVDLMDGAGNVLATKRPIHIMVGSRVRDAGLMLGSDTATDGSDHGDGVVETHIILPPTDATGAMAPIPGTRHGFLHLMFEKVSLTR